MNDDREEYHDYLHDPEPIGNGAGLAWIIVLAVAGWMTAAGVLIFGG